MKKTLVLLLCLAVLFACGMTLYASEYTVLVNGEAVFFDPADQQPVMINNRILVPMRAIFEAMGAKVDWESNTRTAVASKPEVRVEMRIDSKLFMRNGAYVLCDVEARLIGDRTMIPTRAFAESIGAEVDWDQENQTVIINANLTPSEEEWLTFETTALCGSIVNYTNKILVIAEENPEIKSSVESLFLESVKGLEKIAEETEPTKAITGLTDVSNMLVNFYVQLSGNPVLTLPSI